MIQIEGLNTRQKILANLVWSCVTHEALDTIVRSLPNKQDKCDCLSIIQIIKQEYLEMPENRDELLWSLAMEYVEKYCAEVLQKRNN
jgi:hypothetical protein